MELLTFGEEPMSCFIMLLVFLHWNLYIWGQVVGWKFWSPVLLKQSQWLIRIV
jgi:hypothetical protein